MMGLFCSRGFALCFLLFSMLIPFFAGSIYASPSPKSFDSHRDNPEYLNRIQIINAIKANNISEVEELLLAGVDPNYTDNYSRKSLLHLAVYSPEVLQVLIENGAKIEARDGLGKTPLQYAVEFKIFKSSEILLIYGANPNNLDNKCNTPLNTEFLDHNFIEILVEAGADLNIENCDGLTPYEREQTPFTFEVFRSYYLKYIMHPKESISRVRGFSDNIVGRVANTSFYRIHKDDLKFEVPVEVARANRKVSNRKRKNSNITKVKMSLVPANQLQIMVISSSPAPFYKPKSEANNTSEYSGCMFYVDDEGVPQSDFAYSIDLDSGMGVLGKSNFGGYSIRFYTPQAENYTSRDLQDSLIFKSLNKSCEDRVKAENEEVVPLGGARLLTDKTRVIRLQNTDIVEEKYGEKVCIVSDDGKNLITDYPYYLGTSSGFGIAGITDSYGCSAIFFPPESEQGKIEVYFGEDALKMNTLGSKDNSH